MKKTLILVSLFFLSASICAAQSVVDGHVLDTANRPIGNVVVQIERNGNIRHAVSDAEGRFRFAGIDAGEYELRAEAQGYFSAESELVVHPRQPVSVTIEMSPRTTAG